MAFSGGPGQRLSKALAPRADYFCPSGAILMGTLCPGLPLGRQRLQIGIATCWLRLFTPASARLLLQVLLLCYYFVPKHIWFFPEVTEE